MPTDATDADAPGPRAARRDPERLPRSLAPIGELGLRSRGLDPEARDAVLDELFYEGDRRRPYLERYGVLLVLSTLIAALGLIGDSAAVVIGAMLVAPLMTPILAVAAALVQGWTGRAGVALLVVAGGAAAAIATGWLVAELAPIGSAGALPDELLARTHPGLLDLGIAVAAGAAGGYVLVRREAGAALPGVGIAVALVPPLAAVGVLLQLDRTELAEGALLLFATNLAAIVLAAALVLLAGGFVPTADRIRHRRKVRVGLVVTVAFVLVLMAPLAIHTREVVEARFLTAAVDDAVEAWDPRARIAAADVDVVDGVARVDLVVTVLGEARSTQALADEVARRHDGPVALELEVVEARLEEARAG